jgi:hypothetical protein
MGGHNAAESVDSFQRNQWSQCGGIRTKLLAMEIMMPFSTAEWLQSPEAVRAYIEMLEQSIPQLSGSLTALQRSTENKSSGLAETAKNPISRLLPMYKNTAKE